MRLPLSLTVKFTHWLCQARYQQRLIILRDDNDGGDDDDDYSDFQDDMKWRTKKDKR
jgi:hypothetical protein